MATPLTMAPNATIANSKVTDEIRDLLKQLTIEEKVSLLSGTNFVNTASVPRLNIPALKLADSTSAVKGSEIHNGTPTACFPNTSALAATWDRSLLETMGKSVAAQARHKAAQIVLGPTINIHRDPRGGRNFESFSEDPVLTGHLAAALINGIQSQGVGTCVKHFIANESETMRRKCDSKVDERTLREIYLAPFQNLVRECKPTAIMTSYNKLNGTYTCQTPLVKDVLRGEWLYDGLVMSDWFGTTSRLDALAAGLDLEMPGPTVFRGAGLVADVKSGEISESLIDERVTEVLKLISRTKEAHSTSEESSGQDEETSALCRKIAAESIVLLKNEEALLPLNLSPELKVAAIGVPSLIPSGGGGSASGIPQYIQRPYDNIKALHPNPEMVTSVHGVRVNKVIPMITPNKLKTSSGKHGVDINFWNDGDDTPVLTEFMPVPMMVTLGRLKPGLKESGFRYEITTSLTPETTGLHTLAVQATGAVKLFVDGKEVLSAEEPKINMEDFLFVPISHEFRTSIQMTAGQAYKIELKARSRKPHNDGEPTPHSAKICLQEEFSDEKAIEEAAAAAAQSDVSIVFAGRNSEWEGEGSDLESILLTKTQVAQIKSVAAASKKNGGKVVVVLYGGNPFDVSEWVDEVDALVFAHYPGQEGGAALADILTGVVNPSAKLPMSWPKTIEAAPTFPNFPGVDKGQGVGVDKGQGVGVDKGQGVGVDKGQGVEVDYAEGLKVGYRHFWNGGHEKEAQYNFGFGLSYTNFSYSDLKVTKKGSGADSDALLDVQVTVKNVGSVPGAEVVQLYVNDVEASVWRPGKELKGFAKVFLQPGESKIVTLSLLERHVLSFWDVKSESWMAEQGKFVMHVAQLATDYVLEKSYKWNGV